MNFCVHHSSKLDRNSYVGVGHRFKGYNFGTGKFSSLFPLRLAKRHRTGSDALVSISGNDVMWLLLFAYASMDSNGADWLDASGKVVDVFRRGRGPVC